MARLLLLKQTNQSALILFYAATDQAPNRADLDIDRKTLVKTIHFLKEEGSLCVAKAEKPLD